MHNQAVEDQIGSHDIYAVEDITERDPKGFDAKAIIDERHKTHGDFAINALISQRLKGVVYSDWTSYPTLPDSQREALDMIVCKISRILSSGRHDYDDHWKDIAGYARLIVAELNGETVG